MYIYLLKHFLFIFFHYPSHVKYIYNFVQKKVKVFATCINYAKILILFLHDFLHTRDTQPKAIRIFFSPFTFVSGLWLIQSIIYPVLSQDITPIFFGLLHLFLLSGWQWISVLLYILEFHPFPMTKPFQPFFFYLSST